jgi:hypothetical protein
MTEETTAPEAEATEAQAPGLSINDLAVLKSTVEVAANRGAFRAEEMATVGATYNKLAAFVNAAMPKPETEEEQETTAEEATEEEA